jgi:hypothetical protein
MQAARARFLAEVDSPRIAPMSLAYAAPQAVLRMRNRNQMHMIGHQAVRPNLHPALPAPVGHQFHEGRIVFLAEKCLLPTIWLLRLSAALVGPYWRTDGGAGIMAEDDPCVKIGAERGFQSLPSTIAGSL